MSKPHPHHSPRATVALADTPVRTADLPGRQHLPGATGGGLADAVLAGGKAFTAILPHCLTLLTAVSMTSRPTPSQASAASTHTVHYGTILPTALHLSFARRS
jgi:hypothetical protein